jgi:hypothetical protein
MPIVQEAEPLRRQTEVRRKSNFIQRARQLHLYLGTFFAPAILFFAITGSLQTFSFHEKTRGSSYEPPALLVKLGQLHKKQTLTLPPRRPAPPEARRTASEAPPARPAEPNTPPQQPLSQLLMKWFTLLMGTGMVTTTLLGIYMSFKYNRDRRLVWGLLIAGTVLPTVISLATL